MARPPDPPPEFSAIEHYWHFERLCQDLATFKDSKSLTDRDRDYLRALLLGYSSKQISLIITGSEDGSRARTAISTGPYLWLKDLIQAKLNEEFDPTQSRGRHLVLLERLGYRKKLMAQDQAPWIDDKFEDSSEGLDGKQVGVDRSQ